MLFGIGLYDMSRDDSVSGPIIQANSDGQTQCVVPEIRGGASGICSMSITGPNGLSVDSSPGQFIGQTNVEYVNNALCNFAPGTYQTAAQSCSGVMVHN